MRTIPRRPPEIHFGAAAPVLARTRHHNPFEPAGTPGQAHGSLGAIPTRAARDPDGSEVGCRSARFEPGTGERWVETTLERHPALTGKTRP